MLNSVGNYVCLRLCVTDIGTQLRQLGPRRLSGLIVFLNHRDQIIFVLMLTRSSLGECETPTSI